ncbi:MAG: hypothetical protein WD556_07640 [Actinomycetota bacterium]
MRPRKDDPSPASEADASPARVWLLRGVAAAVLLALGVGVGVAVRGGQNPVLAASPADPNEVVAVTGLFTSILRVPELPSKMIRDGAIVPFECEGYAADSVAVHYRITFVGASGIERIGTLSHKQSWREGEACYDLYVLSASLPVEPSYEVFFAAGDGSLGRVGMVRSNAIRLAAPDLDAGGLALEYVLGADNGRGLSVGEAFPATEEGEPEGNEVTVPTGEPSRREEAGAVGAYLAEPCACDPGEQLDGALLDLQPGGRLVVWDPSAYGEILARGTWAVEERTIAVSPGGDTIVGSLDGDPARTVVNRITLDLDGRGPFDISFRRTVGEEAPPGPRPRPPRNAGRSPGQRAIGTWPP